MGPGVGRPGHRSRRGQRESNECEDGRAKAAAGSRGFTDTTFIAGESYSYRVVAFNAAGDSVSNAVNVAQQTVYGVVTASGLAVANAIVYPVTTAGVWWPTYTTNASGAYILSLPAGTYKFYVQPAAGHHLIAFARCV
ncbi:MAG: carboxypeptidase-like regulatory domain-containing protein, partial [Pseudonocardiales bacterium]